MVRLTLLPRPRTAGHGEDALSVEPVCDGLHREAVMAKIPNALTHSGISLKEPARPGCRCFFAARASRVRCRMTSRSHCDRHHDLRGLMRIPT